MLIIILCTFALCFLIEKLIPGWKLPAVPTWTIRVLAINFVQLTVVVAAGFSWEKWFSRWSLFQLSHYVPDWLGGVLAYFIATLYFTGGTDGGTKAIICGGIFTRYTIVRNALKSSLLFTSTR